MALASGITAFVLAWGTPAEASAQQTIAASTSSLVFNNVTVVDVESGKLVPNQRVMIAGNHIQAVGPRGAVGLPKGARVVDAQGKYLIPGLWDMHVHPGRETDAAYPRLVAYGVTGIRDAGSPVPLDTLRLWRQEIWAGTRVGPPRQLLSGQSITGPVAECDRRQSERRSAPQTCVADSADAVGYVDSLKAAGADMIKPREVTRKLYSVIAAEARRLGIPFGGHAAGWITDVEASDQGATIVDHGWGDAGCAYQLEYPLLGAFMQQETSDPIPPFMELGIIPTVQDKGFKPGDPQLVSCQRDAVERFRRNGTWFVPTMDSTGLPGPGATPAVTSVHVLSNFRFGLPLLAGTDAPRVAVTDSDPSGKLALQAYDGWGVVLHQQLAIYVSLGLTPLEALQTATLNPAKMLRATDSLGTVAPGKLADLVLLDADPLAKITNTMAIRGVVANGRYFDRAALDSLIAKVVAQSGRRSKHP